MASPRTWTISLQSGGWAIQSRTATGALVAESRAIRAVLGELPQAQQRAHSRLRLAAHLIGDLGLELESTTAGCIQQRTEHTR